MNIRKFTICLVENYLLQKVGWRGIRIWGDWEGVTVQCYTACQTSWEWRIVLENRCYIVGDKDSRLVISLYVLENSLSFSGSTHICLRSTIFWLSYCLCRSQLYIPSGQIANLHVLIVVEKKSSLMLADKTQLKHSRMLDTVTRQEKSLMVYLLVLWNAWYVLPYLRLRHCLPFISPHSPNKPSISNLKSPQSHESSARYIIETDIPLARRPSPKSSSSNCLSI